MLDSFVIIDTETTGFQLHYDRIVEVGALKVENNRVTDFFREYIKPQNLYRLNPNVSKINGITEATLINAAPAENVLPRFLEFVGNSIVIAHNAKFDLDFINADLSDTNSGFSFTNKFIDSLEVSRDCFPAAPNHKLATLVSYLRLNAKNAHNVFDDCKCVYELIGKAILVLSKKGKSLDGYVRTSEYTNKQEWAANNRTFFESKKSETTSFTEIHKNAPTVYSRYELSRLAAEMRPQKYIKQDYTKPEPSRDRIIKVLEFEAEQKIKSSLFRTKKIAQYVSDNIDTAYNVEYLKWQSEKEQFEKEQNLIQEREDQKLEKQYQEKLKRISEQCAGKENFIVLGINTALDEVNFPYRIEYEYSINLEERIVWISANLPEMEQLPAEKYEYGSVIGKKKTQKEIKLEYVQCCFSISVYIASLIFEISPKIQHVVISENTKRRNKDGDLKDECVLSIKFNREPFENTNIRNSKPQEFCMQFENRCNITTTGIMKAIKPFELENTVQ